MKSQLFKNTKTNEITHQVPIFSIGDYEELNEPVYMNPHTGSVDTKDGWLGDMSGLVEVVWDNGWVEA